jgi:CheY-like chemotaxis protein
MIALLDLDMPGIDREAVLAAVETSPALARRHVFILFMAHQGHLLSLQQAQLPTALAVPHLEKFFELEGLLGVIQEAKYRLAESGR